MADAFTDMHRQLDGRIDDQPDYDEGARKAVARYAKKQPNRLEVEVELLETLGLGVTA